RSAGATSASTSASRWTAAASRSATRCRSASRSRPSSSSDPARGGLPYTTARSRPGQRQPPERSSGPRRSHMPAAGAASRAVLSRFHDAVNTGDMEIISKTIDEVVDPDVLFHAPVPAGATGVQALKQVWVVLLRAFPDLHVAVEDVIAEGDKAVARNT